MPWFAPLARHLSAQFFLGRVDNCYVLASDVRIGPRTSAFLVFEEFKDGDYLVTLVEMTRSFSSF